MACLWKHEWGKWEEEQRAQKKIFVESTKEWVAQGTLIVQVRQCATCGLKDFKRNYVGI